MLSVLLPPMSDDSHQPIAHAPLVLAPTILGYMDIRSVALS